MIAFIFLSTTFQLPNHLFRLITIECWYHHIFIPEIISNLLLLLMTLAEIVFSVWHLKIILEKIYQQQQQQESQKTTSVSKNDDNKHQQQYVGYDNCWTCMMIVIRMFAIIDFFKLSFTIQCSMFWLIVVMIYDCSSRFFLNWWWKIPSYFLTEL